jgi:SAM-dependent methyltransferase
MSSRTFLQAENKLCNHRLVYWFLSFFAVLPPPLWDSRRRVWKIADNAKYVLDVGCGFAHLTRSSKAKNVVGIDLDRNALSEANHYGKSNFFPVFCSATNLPFAENAFDAVVATELIEHIVDDVSFMKEISGVLMKKGVLLCSTPNGEFLSVVHRDHVRHYTQEALCSLLARFFQIRQIDTRFGTSFFLACRLTNLRPLKRNRSGNNPEQKVGSRGGSLKFFLLNLPLLIVMSPIVNIIQGIENRTRKGRCNFVAECIKL